MNKIKKAGKYIDSVMKVRDIFPPRLLCLNLFTKFYSQLPFLSAMFYMPVVRHYTTAIETFLLKNIPELVELAKEISESTTVRKNNSSLKKIIWQFWGQGQNQVPFLVQKCMNSVAKHNSDADIRVLSMENYQDYIDVPASIQKRVDQGNMTITHFSDYLRVKLLSLYGGIWVDATVFMTQSIPEKCFRQFYSLHPVDSSIASPTVSHHRWATFILSGQPEDPLYRFLSNAFELYWTKYSKPVDYLLIDYLIDIAIQMIPTVKEEVDNVPTSNMYAYQLQALLTKSYQNNVTSIQKLLDSDTWMFKLTYKDVAEDLLQRYNSVFSYLNRKTLDDN